MRKLNGKKAAQLAMRHADMEEAPAPRLMAGSWLPTSVTGPSLGLGKSGLSPCSTFQTVVAEVEALQDTNHVPFSSAAAQ